MVIEHRANTLEDLRLLRGEGRGLFKIPLSRSLAFFLSLFLILELAHARICLQN